MKKKELIAILVISFLLIVLTLSTYYYGDVDMTDYMESARYFSGEYSAKVRSLHSFFLGLMHFPFVDLFDSYVPFKISSLLFLFAIIYSVYLISGKSKKAFWLMFLSPIVWYMAPAIHPIPIASFFFLWGFYFLRKYNDSDKLADLLYSGILIGLAWVFWDGIIHVLLLLTISFFYDKKAYKLLFFIAFVFLGFLPKLMLDFYLFNFPFYGIIRFYSSFLTLSLFGGFYNQGVIDKDIIQWIALLLFLPLYSYLLFRKDLFSKNKKTAVFLILFAFILVFNPQARFTLLIIPTIVAIISTHLTVKQFKLQLLLFVIFVLLVVSPYVIQIKYDTPDKEIVTFLSNFGNWNFTPEFRDEVLKKDLIEISKDYPGEVFLVGNNPNDYKLLALLYFGKDVKEFVSIEDYYLNEKGGHIFEKSFCTNPNVMDRRDMCVTVGMFKSFKDQTNYSDIKFAISEEKTFAVPEFKPLKKYRLLSVFSKEV